jgi:hypothetical protein
VGANQIGGVAKSRIYKRLNEKRSGHVGIILLYNNVRQ